MDGNENSDRLIGITGTIGSGKSRVCRHWAEKYLLPLIDLDSICRELLRPGQDGALAVAKRFDGRFFTADGFLDRKQLRQVIFSDSGIRTALDETLHPLARREMIRQAARFREPCILVEVPLLFESGWHHSFGHSVLVYADEEACCRRIVSRDRVSGQQARDAIRSQMSVEDKVMLADHVINNNGSWAGTMLEIARLHEVLVKEPYFLKQGGENS